MSLKENRNWLIIPVVMFCVFLILYTINIFGNFGLIFWEIAYYLVVPCILITIWAARRIIGVKKNRIIKYAHELIIFSFIISLSFSIFAFIPFMSVRPLGLQFEEKFKEKLGNGYWEKIPKKYQDRLKAPNYYSDSNDLRNFYNRRVELEEVKYGDDEYQVLDKYDDPTIMDKDKPAFIYVHGGGSTTFVTKDTGKRSCTYFASLGFVSFSIEYTPAPIEPFPKAVADVMKAIVFIKNHHTEYNIDKDLIVLLGPSRGGHLVTQCAYVGVNNDAWWRAHGANYNKEDLKVACVVDMYGATNQFYAAEHDGFLEERNEIIFGGTPEEKEELYEKHTVMNYVSHDIPPTLIMHGTIDRMVQVGESRSLVDKMEAENADYIYLEVYFGQHTFDTVSGTAGNDLAYYFIPRFVLAVLYGDGFK